MGGSLIAGGVPNFGGGGQNPRFGAKFPLRGFGEGGGVALNANNLHIREYAANGVRDKEIDLHIYEGAWWR